MKRAPNTFAYFAFFLRALCVKALAFALASFGTCIAVAAQQPAPIVRPPQSELQAQPDQIPTITVESRLVSVALNVTDDKGAPVPGLSAADFAVTEDARPQTIAVFERESATPLQIVLALDTSESVFTDEKLEKDAARSFVKSLVRGQDRIDLMDFADNVDEVVAFTNDPRAIESGLNRLRRGDSTALYDAVYLASERLAAQLSANGARRVIVLITDGENTTRHGTYDAALEQAERAGAMIYSLIIVPIQADAGRNTGGEHALIQMARDTGGRYYYVYDKHDLSPAFQHVSDDLRTQYTVGYYALAHGVEFSGLRQIRIELKDPTLRAKYTLRYRTAYYGSK
jgi:Ca-activated chloride channel family protein